MVFDDPVVQSKISVESGAQIISTAAGEGAAFPPRVQAAIAIAGQHGDMKERGRNAPEERAFYSLFPFIAPADACCRHP